MEPSFNSRIETLDTNPDNWPREDELPQADISDIEAVYRATIAGENLE